MGGVPDATVQVRHAAITEVDALARLWFDGWQDAHAAILPPALQQLRTLESFRERLLRGLSQVYAAGPVNMPLGFYVLKHDELDQLFVSAQARGTGVAGGSCRRSARPRLRRPSTLRAPRSAGGAEGFLEGRLPTAIFPRPAVRSSACRER